MTDELEENMTAEEETPTVDDTSGTEPMAEMEPEPAHDAEKNLDQEEDNKELIVEDEKPENWPADSAYYTIESWKGLPNYCCRYCKYRTLNGNQTASDGKPVMVSHFLAFHTGDPATTKLMRSATGLVGPNGQLL